MLNPPGLSGEPFYLKILFSSYQVITFVLTGRGCVCCPMPAGCYPGLWKPLGFQPASACCVTSPPLLVGLLTPVFTCRVTSPPMLVWLLTHAFVCLVTNAPNGATSS